MSDDNYYEIKIPVSGFVYMRMMFNAEELAVALSPGALHPNNPLICRRELEITGPPEATVLMTGEERHRQALVQLQELLKSLNEAHEGGDPAVGSGSGHSD